MKLLGTFVLAAAPLFTDAKAPLPDVTPPPNLTVSAESCRPCHQAVFAQWQRSRHAQAWTNRLFAESFRREPLRWCIYCHAPAQQQFEQVKTARHVAPGRAPLADEGVNCAVCHLRNGKVLSSRNPSADALAAHPVIQDARVGTEALCAGCHQFEFPEEREGPVVYTGAPMQDTVAEWRSSQVPAHGKSCLVCHMPEGEHAFRGGHDASWVGAAVSVAAERKGSAVDVTLRSNGVAHRLPTGDPFRSLAVELCADEACEQVVGTVEFTRRFRRTAKSWTLAEDTTVPPPKEGAGASRTFRLELPADAPASLFWRLAMRYPDPASAKSLEGDDLELEISRGAVR